MENIVPIGDYEPRWFMTYRHPQLLPIHFGMFPLADTGYEQPLMDLRQAMGDHLVEEGVILPLMAGESWDVP